MDKYQAQFNFWSSFGIPAYEENTVPDADYVAFPYITYQAVNAGFDEDAVVNASIWTRNTSWEQADNLANTVQNALRNGGVVVPYTGGMIWVTPENPLIQNMGDPNDDRIRRKLLTVQLHFN